MANSQNLNIRIDPELKHQAEAILSELGLPTSTAVTLFLKSVVRYGGIPFELRVKPGEAATDEKEASPTCSTSS
jgi:DNA-damage-inducible protein J